MRRNELVAYRVNEKEKHEIEMLSQLHGMSKSALIRSLVKREVEDQAYIVEIVSKNDPVELARSMRIGR